MHFIQKGKQTVPSLKHPLKRKQNQTRYSTVQYWGCLLAEIIFDKLLAKTTYIRYIHFTNSFQDSSRTSVDSLVEPIHEENF